MLEVGHEFKRNGTNFCVVDILNYKGKNYCFLSEERKNEKIDFNFYEYSFDCKGDSILQKVKDDNLISILIGLIKGE